MLTDEQAGKLFKALFEFAKDGTETDFDDGMIAMAFSFMADSIKRDTEKYEQVCESRRASGKLGGRPKKEPNALDKKANGFLENQTKAKKADIDSLSLNHKKSPKH